MPQRILVPALGCKNHSPFVSSTIATLRDPLSCSGFRLATRCDQWPCLSQLVLSNYGLFLLLFTALASGFLHSPKNSSKAPAAHGRTKSICGCFGSERSPSQQSCHTVRLAKTRVLRSTSSELVSMRTVLCGTVLCRTYDHSTTRTIKIQLA